MRAVGRGLRHAFISLRASDVLDELLAEVFGVGGRDGFCEFSAVSRVGDPHRGLPLFDGAFAAAVAVDGEHVAVVVLSVPPSCYPVALV